MPSLTEDCSMSKQTLNETLLLVGLLVVVISLFCTVQFASECHAAGGAVVKGIIWWECIK